MIKSRLELVKVDLKIPKQHRIALEAQHSQFFFIWVRFYMSIHMDMRDVYEPSYRRELLTKWVHTARHEAGIQTNGKQGTTEARKEIVNHANEDTKPCRRTVNWRTLINIRIFVTVNQPLSLDWEQSLTRKGNVLRLMLPLANGEGICCSVNVFAHTESCIHLLLKLCIANTTSVLHLHKINNLHNIGRRRFRLLWKMNFSISDQILSPVNNKSVRCSFPYRRATLCHFAMLCNSMTKWLGWKVLPASQHKKVFFFSQILQIGTFWRKKKLADWNFEII